MYAFKNAVYLVLGIAFVLLAAALLIGGYSLVGVLLVILGIAMSTFAAYQMGQSSPPKTRQ